LTLPRSRQLGDPQTQQRRRDAAVTEPGESALQPVMSEVTAREVRRLLAEALVADYRQQNQGDLRLTVQPAPGPNRSQEDEL
jgi:hypothetical protein